MDKHYHHTLITAIIETIGSWTEADRNRLASMLGGHCWPGGPIDHREPGGMQALRQWRPGGATPALLACSCAARALPHLQLSRAGRPRQTCHNVRSRACRRAFDC